ncbi:AAA family ATPase [Ferrimonas balearica]|uniref:AAA family ATPase n=1 Tax=Ferrimonas balearica TaxID=44012 RepID=UPI001F43122F|nr:AAA family ATPase [Ferrimonas balearica]MBY6096413.1 AAA family ATPase [Ferrimonas balearica]
MTSRRQRLKTLLNELKPGLYERDDALALTLLATLSGHHTFLYGPPGTGKSLLARRVAAAFADSAYFECLMNRFSTPDEVFGPVALSALKADRYERQTEGYLPRADLAFLDEIFKASPAILNTLLTLINERQFRNGDQLLPVPLKGLITAANEIPEVEAGLDALYDRLLVRLIAAPTQDWDNFSALLQGSANPPVQVSQPIDTATWQQWHREMATVRLDPQTLLAIARLRTALARQLPDLYLSDRRWQWAAGLLKAAAYFEQRHHTQPGDLLLLTHVLWHRPEQQATVATLVANELARLPLNSEPLLNELEWWESRLHQQLFYQEDAYDTVEFFPQQFFFANQGEQRQERGGYFYVKRQAVHIHRRAEPVHFDFFVHQSQMTSRAPFHPFDPLGHQRENVQCQFRNNGILTIRYDELGRFDHSAYEVEPFSPPLKQRKGERRAHIDPDKLAEAQAALAQLRQGLDQLKAEAELLLGQLKQQPEPLFVRAEALAQMANGWANGIEDLALSQLRCDALISLANDVPCST